MPISVVWVWTLTEGLLSRVELPPLQGGQLIGGEAGDAFRVDLVAGQGQVAGAAVELRMVAAGELDRPGVLELARPGDRRPSVLVDTGAGWRDLRVGADGQGEGIDVLNTVKVQANELPVALDDAALENDTDAADMLIAGRQLQRRGKCFAVGRVAIAQVVLPVMGHFLILFTFGVPLQLISDEHWVIRYLGQQVFAGAENILYDFRCIWHHMVTLCSCEGHGVLLTSRSSERFFLFPQ